ncbi:MAG TPA: hypothetical protein VKD67_09275, partial [Acidimicrobiales bacterium]|nr:hypothetical protein [Acidimicrobiales bacterium]
STPGGCLRGQVTHQPGHGGSGCPSTTARELHQSSPDEKNHQPDKNKLGHVVSRMSESTVVEFLFESLLLLRAEWPEIDHLVTWVDRYRLDLR